MAGGFPPAEIPTLNEVVSLPENSTTLELRFRFIYPGRHPELTDIDFPTLVALTEAAEKFQVYLAMVVGKLRWNSELSRHPLQAMNYGAKHGYMDIVDRSAPRLIVFSLEDIAHGLSPNLAIPWKVRCYSHWMNVFDSMSIVHGASGPGNGCLVAHSHATGLFSSRNTPGAVNCPAWAEVTATIITKMGGRVASLADLPSIFDISTPLSCPIVQTDVAEWLKEGQAKIKKIPRFSTLL